MIRGVGELTNSEDWVMIWNVWREYVRTGRLTETIVRLDVVTNDRLVMKLPSAKFDSTTGTTRWRVTSYG